MSNVPNLLNNDGSASIATALMMSHHGFRRDLARFVKALQRIAAGDAARATAVSEEWQRFHATLHGHHESEDNGAFPSLARDHASVRATIEKLGADHRRIDPLLERGDRAFAELRNGDQALAIVRELQELLHPHLALEEAELVPFLRSGNVFPPPPTDEAAAIYAQGFAWAMNGIAVEVLERIHEMLPERLRVKLPAARAEFEARCLRVWGTAGSASSRTPVPEPDAV